MENENNLALHHLLFTLATNIRGCDLMAHLYEDNNSFIAYYTLHC